MYQFQLQTSQYRQNENDQYFIDTNLYFSPYKHRFLSTEFGTDTKKIPTILTNMKFEILVWNIIGYRQDLCLGWIEKHTNMCIYDKETISNEKV